MSIPNTTKSPIWYFLPMILGFVGGIIVYLILKNKDNKKAKRALIIGIIFSIPLFMWFLSQIVYGTQNPFYVVASGGMIPALQVYDILIVQGHTPFEDVKVGDIIVFNGPTTHDRVIVQRVASIIDDDPKTIRTKGDANPASIPGTDFAITKLDYIGKVTYVIPQMGYVIQFLKPPINYLIIFVYVLIPLVLHFLYKQKLKRQSSMSSSRNTDDDTQIWD